MKKRMLITTIVMLLVLAVALTTSSLAWFSAQQSNVVAQSGGFQAATNSSNVALGIAKDALPTVWKQSIVLTRDIENMMPYAPAYMNNKSGKIIENSANGYWDGFATYEDVLGFNLNSAETVDGKFAINAAGEGQTAHTITTKALSATNNGTYHDSFYLRNIESQNMINSLAFTLNCELDLGAKNPDGSTSAKLADAVDNLAQPVFLIVISEYDVNAANAINTENASHYVDGEYQTGYPKVYNPTIKNYAFVTFTETGVVGNAYTTYLFTDADNNSTLASAVAPNTTAEACGEWAINTYPAEEGEPYYRVGSSANFIFNIPMASQEAQASATPATNNVLKVDVFAWFDGATLDTARAGTKVVFDFKIDASLAVATTGNIITHPAE